MNDTLATTVGREFVDELQQARNRIGHCLDQLSEDQVWWRPTDAMNSIGNLLLHLAGNIRQWLVSGVGGAPDIRQRQAEFDARGPISKQELLARLDSALTESASALMRQGKAGWLRPLRIQRHQLIGFSAALHSIAHFRGHVQEIIHMTRTILGDRYQFAWVPTTKEEGAK